MKSFWRIIGFLLAFTSIIWLYSSVRLSHTLLDPNLCIDYCGSLSMLSIVVFTLIFGLFFGAIPSVYLGVFTALQIQKNRVLIGTATSLSVYLLFILATILYHENIIFLPWLFFPYF